MARSENFCWKPLRRVPQTLLRSQSHVFIGAGPATKGLGIRRNALWEMVTLKEMGSRWPWSVVHFPKGIGLYSKL